MSIKAIETEYRGYRFRSRLEARWAVFFDECGFRWEYEPQGYEVDGEMYLPDFLLHDVQRRKDERGETGLPFFVEVKGDMDSTSRTKIDKLSWYCPVYVVGNIPEVSTCLDFFDEIVDVWQTDTMFFSYRTIDFDTYPAGLFRGKQGLPVIVGPDHSDDLEKVDWEGTIRAYRAARAARFEHGEKPAPIWQRRTSTCFDIPY